VDITFKEGDATRPDGEGVTDDHKLIVHCCNNRGAWGAGFVLAISKRWPEAEFSYRKWHSRFYPQYLPLGKVDLVNVEPDVTVCNLIGQTLDSGRRIRYDAIYDGLHLIDSIYGQVGWSSDPTTTCTLHMPRMGAGLAGGDWNIIEAIIRSVVTIPVTVYDLPVVTP
jgi:O-acetyl-ADP-ribose deacetylase (regulator of RNase III)